MTDLPVRHIYRWDLDKTYLETEFDTVRDLIRTAFQKADEKHTVPGADALLKELVRDQDESRVLLTFISGSPTMMRDVLEEKFALDGIHPDAFILKPTLKNILKGRFKAIKGQVGYKLEALLRIRIESPDARETLFGDDSEQDAFIYSLYADIVRGRIEKEELRTILVEAEVYASPIERILDLAEKVPISEKIRRIFIHLDRDTPPGRFRVFGPNVVPVSNYFQAAVILVGDRTLPAEGLFRVANHMVEHCDYDVLTLANSFHDLIRRHHLSIDAIDRLDEYREEFSSSFSPELINTFIQRVRALAPLKQSELNTDHRTPDYVEILKFDRGLKESLSPRKRTKLFGRK